MARARTGWARVPCHYLGAIGELVLQPVEQSEVGLGERPGGRGGPGQAELLPPLLHRQVLRRVRPHCGQSGAQRGAALPHRGVQHPEDAPRTALLPV